MNQPKCTPTLPAIAVAIAATAMLGCGSSGANKTTAATAPQTAQAALYGSYERMVTNTDLHRTAGIRHEGPGQSPPPPGRYRLSVVAGPPGDVLTSVDPTGFPVAMKVNATPAGQLAIQGYVDPHKGSDCGPNISAQATYAWAASGGHLVLHAVTDPCADRDSILTGTWLRR